MTQPPVYRTLDEFYPFYLSEHSHRVSRWLHFTGTTNVIILLVITLVTQIWWLLAVALVQAYAFAWVGHFFFEHNRPATFQYPVLSLRGDWRMWWEMLTGKISF